MIKDVWAWATMALVAVGTLAACGSDDDPAPPGGGTGATAGFSGGGGTAGFAGGLTGGTGAVSGSGGTAGGATGGTGGAPPACNNCTGFPAGECTDCIKAQCCTECESFVVNPDAINIFNCIGNCSDTACADACVAANPNGQADYEALLGEAGCVSNNCSAACFGENCGPLSYNDPTCQDCFVANCCAEGMACNADCMDYFNCIQACSDQTCADTCASTYATGKALLDAMDTCVETNCEDECGGTTGCGFTFNDPDCNTCFTDECCDEGAACAASADCIGFFDCIRTCTDASCEDQCANQYPAGAALMDDMDHCVFASCSGPTQCGGTCGGLAFGGGSCDFDTEATCTAASDCVWDPTGGSAGTGSCESDCNMCYQTSCCAEGLACAADAACGDYLWCIWGCEDAACEAACETQFPGGVTLLDAIDTCIEAQCDAECGNPCGLAFSDPICNTCFETNCCVEGNACGDAPACTDYLSCVNGCTTQACADACDTSNPGGKALLDAIDTCVEAACVTECNINACGLSFTDPTCNTCYEASCCDEGNACADSLDCMTYLDCAQDCSSQAECDACDLNTLGKALSDALDTCVETSCDTECGNACGVAFSDPTCNTCYEANCCDEGLACEASTDCTDYLRCIGFCSDQPCVDACGTAHAAGMALNDAIETCVAASCATECPTTP